MYAGTTLFAQVMDFLPWKTFHRIVDRHRGDHRVRTLTCADCALDKSRWQVELFFKWIKQYLPIKCFFGTSENAVKTQIGSAISVYVLVAIIKKQLRFDASLYTSLQILSVTPFEKIPLLQDFSERAPEPNQPMPDNQLNLFGP